MTSLSTQAVYGDLDAMWTRRDAPEVIEGTERTLEAAFREVPDDVGLLWRAARFHFWRAELSDDPGTKERASRRGWDEAERALEKAPDCPEARYWAAAACGTYAEAVGVLAALSQGVDPKLRKNLDWVVAHAPDLERGGPLLTLGRYWAQLPWPKRDRKKAVASLRAALQAHPENLRARLYLAEVLLAEGGAARAEGQRLIDEILLATPGGYDAPEERLIQRRAKALRPPQARGPE